jgi:hypothetical protein
MNSLKKAEIFNQNLKKQKALKLDAYKESIMYLLSNDTSILAIQQYLLEKEKITISYSNLHKYVKKISISNDKKIDSNTNSKVLSQQSNYEKIEEYCEQLKIDFIPRSEHFKYQTIESIINYFVKKSQETKIPILKDKSKNNDSSVEDNNSKTYTLGAKVSKKMNIDGA